jgi:syntaxin 1B/2/3
MSYGGYKDQGNPYGNPYTSASNTEAGYGQGQEQHEMQTYTQQGQYGEQQYNTLESYNAPPADLQDFLRRRNGVAEQISKLGGETDSISTKQREALRSASPEHLQQEVQEMIQRFRLTASNIRSQIQALNDEATREGNETKVQHVNILFGDFKNKLSALQQAESGYNQDLRQRMMREYRIVHPNAPDEEAMRAVSDQASYGEGGVFTQAVCGLEAP